MIHGLSGPVFSNTGVPSTAAYLGHYEEHDLYFNRPSNTKNVMEIYLVGSDHTEFYFTGQHPETQEKKTILWVAIAIAVTAATDRIPFVEMPS
jgi:hypothetical protein